MLAKVLEGTLVLRQWNRVSGLTETTKTFASLDELYAYCLAVTDPELVERVVIQGQDEKGRLRILTFVFQSITVTSQK